MTPRNGASVLSNERLFIYLNLILFNIMFHAPMGRFQLEITYYFTYFSPSSHPIFVFFFPVGLSFINTTFSTSLVGVEVSSISWLGQLTVGV